jgi:hypothetical protein
MPMTLPLSPTMWPRHAERYPLPDPTSSTLALGVVCRVSCVSCTYVKATEGGVDVYPGTAWSCSNSRHMACMCGADMVCADEGANTTVFVCEATTQYDVWG